jgi:hypothetical protein
MLVKTQTNGPHTGLLIGVAHAQRYFSRPTQAIDLLLDGVRIQCTLSADFWQDRPEIHDSRLSAWLEFKVAGARRVRTPSELTLVPAGANAFVLCPKLENQDQGFGADVACAKPVRSTTSRRQTRGPATLCRMRKQGERSHSKLPL